MTHFYLRGRTRTYSVFPNLTKVPPMLKRYSWRINCYMVGELLADVSNPADAELLAAMNKQCMLIFARSSMSDNSGQLEMRVSDVAGDVLPLASKR